MVDLMSSTITEYLRNMVEIQEPALRSTAGKERRDWKFHSVEDLVLHYGQPFRPAPRPEGMEQGEMKQCFANSMKLAIDHADLVYVEGYANTRWFPMQHGWLTQDGQGAIDPTWDDGTEYFGIPFTRKFWSEYMLKAGYWGILFPDLPHKHLIDLLKNGLPPGAVATIGD